MIHSQDIILTFILEAALIQLLMILEEAMSR